MFSFSPPIAGWLTSTALGLWIVGATPALAEDRGLAPSRSPERQSTERSTLDRQSLSRSTENRTPVERQPLGRQAPERRQSPGQVQRPTVTGQTPTVTDQTPIRPATNAIIAPRPLERCLTRPTPEVWRRRDIMAEIQGMARRGFIAVHPIGENVSEFTGVSDFPAGWKAYGFNVPPGENIHVRLNHANEGWFRLTMHNRWGGSASLQNVIPTGNPEVTYTNVTKGPQAVYVVVDDPGWMSSKENPFKMKVDRSWAPAKEIVGSAPIVSGIWAQKADEPKVEPTTKGASPDAKVETLSKG